MSFFGVNPTFFACALTTFSLSGCVVNADPGPDPVSSGTISLLSSIEDSTHPSECDYVGATDLELALYEGASHYTTVTSSCYDFALTVSLPVGSYNGDVTLLDEYAQPVSTTLTLDNLRVVDGTDLQIFVDFPSSSILP